MRCAIYARYSSEMQKDKSIDDQIRNCQQFAQGRKWLILKRHIYADKAVSGASVIGRIQLSRLLEVTTTKPRPFDYVLIDDTSRLSRDKIDQASIIEEFHDAGVFVYFVTQNIDTADEQANDVVLPIHGIVDALYLKELAKKTQRGMAGQVLAGYNPGGRTYGYNYTPIDDPSGVLDKKTRQVKKLGTAIEINPEEAEVVKLIFDLAVSGIGQKEIARYLNSQGIKPPRGGHRQKLKVNGGWCPNGIRYILQNTKYVGDWTWNKYRWIKNRKTGKRKRRLRPEEEWLRSDRPELAIVEIDVWNRVQERFDKNRHSSQVRSPKKRYLLSGMMRCSICGANIVILGSGKGRDPIYGCGTNWNRGKSICPNNARISRSELEDRMLNAIKEQLLSPIVIEYAIKKIKEFAKVSMANYTQEDDKIKDQIRKHENELNNLVERIAKDPDAPDSIMDAIRAKETMIKEFKLELKNRPDFEGIENLKVDPQYVAERFSDLPELNKKDVTRARQKLLKVLGPIEVTPNYDETEKYVTLKSDIKLDELLGLRELLSKNLNSGGWI